MCVCEVFVAVRNNSAGCAGIPVFFWLTQCNAPINVNPVEGGGGGGGVRARAVDLTNFKIL